MIIKNVLIGYVKAMEKLKDIIKSLYMLYLVLTALIVYEVFSRYVLNSPHDWFVEIALILGMYIGFIGALQVTLEERHITLELFVSRMLSGKQEVAKMITNIFGVILSLTVAYFVMTAKVIKYFVEGAHYLSSLNTPYWIGPLSLALGLIFAAMCYLALIIKQIFKKDFEDYVEEL